ncbi:BEM46 family protein [Coprinopsis cinerea okayama7|uniref:BEM46 family protein n=1 Tax=Coprinopsis cinerea (strain Okayama-7 / 130 / ATCC MYA-4618 / FGSC 9003) TaxID=240176 RepID=A8NM37_COPC7|nr:BEM46 family protein [Coprinopsis cinerea okayama7\|eukprot:XP_001834838.2 BEM46 family protein [Coprinopsis cinerea okayama7\
MSRFLPSLEGFVKGTAATAATLSTVGAGLLWYGQNYLIYPSAFPPGSRTEVANPGQFGMPYEDLELKTPDGVILRCYLLPQRKDLSSHPEATYLDEDFASDEEIIASRPTVIMFHGNGGNHGHRIPLAKVFYMRMRCNVFMMSYRGYGLSEGSPSEKGLQIDAQTALDYLTGDPVFSKTPIILYGQSIGGAVSIDLASRNPSKIAALILENTFTSLPNLIPHALPALSSVSFLCHQKWDSINKIPLIPATTPILMLSGMLDEIVPKEHMRALWEAVAKRGEKKGKNGGNGGSGSGSESEQPGLERAKYMEFDLGGHSAYSLPVHSLELWHLLNS